MPIADDDSTTSEAARAILYTPSPARIVRGPIPIESTPLGRLPTLEASLRPGERGRHSTSIRKWNIDVSRAYSPLPPSSPPPPSPPTQIPIATSSQPRYQADFSDQPDEAQPAHGPVYVKRDTPPSDDDLFGLLAAERKLKTIRQRRTAIESSRAAGGVRAPLGTLALDEVPSVAVSIPDRLPTPIPSDDDHNIDDLYLDVDPVRPGPSHLDDSDTLEDENKENVPTEDYDLNEDKENMCPPHLVFDDFKEDDGPGSGSGSERDDVIDENENSIAPILLVSARKMGLDQLLESPSSSSDSPTHALRTPHKHRSAHHRSPLPTPHFSDGGLLDDPGMMGSDLRNESPSPVKKPSAVRPADAKGKAVDKDKGKGKGREKAGPSKPRQPLATLEYEDPHAEPPKVAGKKRARGVEKEKEKEKKEKSSEEDSDPKAAVRRLEALLPKRPKKKVRVGEASGTRGEVVKKGKGKGKGKRRENVPESTESRSVSEDEDDGMRSDSSPPTPPARAARGRGRGRGRGGRGQGRGRGRGAAAVSNARTAVAKPASRGRSTSRGRPPASKDKGKKRAIEEVDPDEDEVRNRSSACS